MPTDTFPIAVAGDDESGSRFSTVSWADLLAGNGTFTDGGGSTILDAAKKLVFVTRFEVDNIFLRFDTSSIPDDAVISAANLLIVPADITHNPDGVEYAADFYDFGGAPAVNADMEAVSSGDAIASIALGSLVNLSVNTLALTGLSGINKAGYTGIRIAAKNTTQPTGDNFFDIVSFENASFQEPRLEVTYAIPSVGPNYPATNATLANAGTLENAEPWVTPANAGADDGTVTQITAATYDSPDISELLVCSNFGFTLADDAQIKGILVEIDRNSAAGSASENRVQLAKGTTFASLVGSNKADFVTSWPGALASVSYGGSSDLWGTSWTAAEINSSSFAVMLSVQADSANTDVAVDFVRVTVYYAPAAAAGWVTTL